MAWLRGRKSTLEPDPDHAGGGSTVLNRFSRDQKRAFFRVGRQMASRILPPVVLIALLLLIIQLLADAEIIRSFILPAPSDVLLSLIHDTPAMMTHIFHTLRIALFGYILSCLTGIAFALLMDRFSIVYRAFYPLIVISQTIPTLIITPVIVLIFGYGDLPRLFVVILTCFFPVTISLFQGLKTVDHDMIRLMQTMGATRGEMLRHVKIPGSLPSFFAGLRISATYSVMAVVLAEWAGGGNGLGIYMLRTKRSFRFDAMFASIIWIVVLSLFFYFSAILLERVSMPWETAVRKEKRLEKRQHQL